MSAVATKTRKTRRGAKIPVNGDNQRHYVALLMDHEGRYGVHVMIDGPSQTQKSREAQGPLARIQRIESATVIRF